MVDCLGKKEAHFDWLNLYYFCLQKCMQRTQCWISLLFIQFGESTPVEIARRLAHAQSTRKEQQEMRILSRSTGLASIYI